MIIFALAVGIIYFDIDSEDLTEDNVENVFSDRYVVCIVYEGRATAKSW